MQEAVERCSRQVPPPVVVSEDRAARRAEERNLLLRHRSGDPDAFSSFVEAYKAPVLSYLMRSGLRVQDCEDLFQEIFIKIHCAVDRYDARRPVHPWVFTIVVNTTRSHIRRQTRRHEVGQPDGGLACSAPSAECQLESKQRLGVLVEALKNLPTREREVVLLAGMQRLSMREIAEIVGVSTNTVKTRLRRGRARLLKATGSARSERSR